MHGHARCASLSAGRRSVTPRARSRWIIARYRLGVDVGGTFTDFVLLDEERGAILVGKCLTTAADPGEGFLAGASRLLATGAVGYGDLAAIVHGTTLVANALIERKGAVTGLITSQGCRDILEVSREVRYDLYDLFIEFPQPLAPRALRHEVAERALADGSTYVPLDLDGVRAAARQLVADGATSVAVVFLHSHRNPDPELAAGRLLATELPALDVSLSCQVAPEIREYERTSTTLANAYVRPLVRRYLGHLQAELGELGYPGELYVMLSAGGVTTATIAADVPVHLVESGPAAGALAASFYGGLTGRPQLVSFDMGGTTAKICLINDGQPDGANTVEVARVRRFKKGSGLPLKVPVIEMIEIGAGGGSIARVDNLGLLKVGPDSAGANPGPACYGLGGSEPTVTDADLVLGYLDPDFFLGGELRLDRAAAERAIAERIARPLGVELVTAALGIHDVVNDTMATATRIHVAERGRDPRRYDLMAFGGAGPVHAYELVRLLKLRRVVAPLRAGALSALGLLAAPLAVDLAQAYVGRLDRLDWAHVDRLYGDLEQRASDLLLRAGARREEIVLTRTADLRYVGQGHEVVVPVPTGRLSAQSRAALEETFAETYRQLYDRHLADVPVEALNWRLHGATPPPRVDVTFTGGDAGTEGRGDAETRRAGDAGTGGRGDARKGERAVYFGAAKDYLRTPVYDRYGLRPGDHLSGPAVVEERESTLLIGPGGRAVVDDYLNLIVEVVL